MAQKLALLLALQVLTASAAVTSYTFGQDIDYPPYASKNATSGELTGFGVELVKAMNAHCSATLNITVVETRWSNCWSSAGGGTLGALLEDGTLDACMTYTHTQGIRNDYADFGIGILDVNKAAGLNLAGKRHAQSGWPLGPQRQDRRGCRWLGASPRKEQCTAKCTALACSVCIGMTPA